MKRAHVSSLNFEIPGIDTTPPEWIQLIPAGEQLIGRDRRAWNNSSPDAVVAAFAQDGKDMPIDWEHSTELKAPNGEKAPAAGWITALENRAGAIWGRVMWTPDGLNSVANREYRYISPVFVFDKATSRILRLTSVGLTNRPNLYLPALNSEHYKEEESMMNTQQFASLVAALGLAADATPEQAINHATTLKGDLSTALNQAQSPSLDKFVPKPDYDLALNRAASAEAKLADQAKATLEFAINAEIDTALKAGKITPATVDYHKAQCAQEGGLERFKKYCLAAPTIAADSVPDQKKKDHNDTALNAEEEYVCKALGLTHEVFISSKKGM